MGESFRAAQLDVNADVLVLFPHLIYMFDGTVAQNGINESKSQFFEIVYRTSSTHMPIVNRMAAVLPSPEGLQ